MLGVSEDTVYEMMTNDELDALGPEAKRDDMDTPDQLRRDGGIA